MDTVSRDLGVLAEPVRVRLLALLEHQELGVGELCRVVQLPQSTVSRHLKALQVAGWIRRRAEGTSGLFRVDPASVDPVGWKLWEVVRDAHAGGRQADEDAVRLEAVLASRSETASFFGRRHAEWDALRRELFGDAFLGPALLALIPRDHVVADLGCGTGPVLAELAPVVARVMGFDREPRMVEAALDRVRDHANVSVHLAALEDLPIGDASVDAATCVLVLHHVEDPADVFREAGRVLKPGGTLAVVDMVAHDREDWARTMGHLHLGFDPAALAALAKEEGLVRPVIRMLPPAADAQGPPLFLLVLNRRR
jgi:ArsR family transcriptional regulator